MRTNKIPRQVPEQPWYMHPAFSILIGGILPFGAVRRSRWVPAHCGQRTLLWPASLSARRCF